MQGIIAVEKNLSKLTEVLETEGYEVVNLEHADLDAVDAVLVSGLDINFLNMQESIVNVPVISAVGKTATEILEELAML
ncbi:MAG TPA: YkuS family protein [Negativicutes bacterium]|jgi:hypothetical protein